MADAINISTLLRSLPSQIPQGLKGVLNKTPSSVHTFFVWFLNTMIFSTLVKPGHAVFRNPRHPWLVAVLMCQKTSTATFFHSESTVDNFPLLSLPVVGLDVSTFPSNSAAQSLRPKPKTPVAQSGYFYLDRFYIRSHDTNPTTTIAITTTMNTTCTANITCLTNTFMTFSSFV